MGGSTRRRWLAILGLMAWASSGSARADGPGVPADHAAAMARGLELFRGEGGVRAVLVDRCLKCHGGAKVQGEFDLSSREAMLEDRGEGAAVVPGRSADSRLYRMVAHLDEPAMPEGGAKLDDGSIRKLADWIDAGAPFDRPLAEGRKAAGAGKKAPVDPAKTWAFRPLAKVEIPPGAAGRPAIDRFVDAKLAPAGIPANPEASRRALIRRVTFDLLGLPPAPEAMAAFEADPSPDAYEAMVDRALASPRYGERWARHWLDLARFAESHGYEHDYDRPTAYHYRDWVVRALNEGMPYDRFVRLQVAGDEVEPADPRSRAATGFLAAGVHSTQITANTAEKERYDELDDMAATLGTSMLALTVGCARCHDHKFDPIPTADYYRLAATFTTTVRGEVDLDGGPGVGPVKALVAGEGIAPLRLHTQGADFFEKTYQLRRGDLAQKQGEAAAGFLAALTRADEARWRASPPPGAPQSYRRATLANWLTDVDAGAGALLARVVVNRLWQHHFGVGLVATPSDFGAQGEPPTHPELLDFLAAELVRGGWQLKPIHRQILASAAYRRSSAIDESAPRLDPTNRLLGRQNPRRLEAEAIRDAILDVSGLLDDRPGGPGTLDESMTRRSLYFTVKRSHLIPILSLFDAPDAIQGVGRRPTTTVAPQALALLNHPQVRRAAVAFAARVRSDDPAASIDRAYRLALSRPPDPEERADALAFLESRAPADRADPALEALAELCQAILGLNEFIYVE